MHVQSIAHLLNFTYEKPSAEVAQAAAAKAKALSTMVTERERRVRHIREEYGISDGALAGLLMQARQAAKVDRAHLTYNSRKLDREGHPVEEQATIGVGVINNILTEMDFIEGEKAMSEKLTLIARNVKDVVDKEGIVRGQKLTHEELQFLGF